MDSDIEAKTLSQVELARRLRWLRKLFSECASYGVHSFKTVDIDNNSEFFNCSFFRKRIAWRRTGNYP